MVPPHERVHGLPRYHALPSASSQAPVTSVIASASTEEPISLTDQPNSVTATSCASTDAPVSLSSLIQGEMESTAETRGSLLVALESFRKKEGNGTLTNALQAFYGG